MTIDELMADKEKLQAQLKQLEVQYQRVQGAIAFIDQKLKEDFEKNAPKKETPS